MPVDPSRDAVRADLADIRLADRVFAPHYAQALRHDLLRDAELRDQAGTVVAMLAGGEPFEVLEIGREHAWGIAPSHGRVGYLPVGVLRR